MAVQIHLEQGSNAWLEFRHDKIGGSDAPAIMGVSPWKKPYGLWREKMGLSSNGFKSAAMQRGIDLESKARDWVNAQLITAFEPAIFVSSDIHYMMISLDGWDKDGGRALEIKCPGEKDHALAKKGKIPDYYFPQLQHAMYVMNLQEMLYCSFDGEEGVFVTVIRDDEYITKLLIEEDRFYQCLLQRIPPECKEDEYIEIENTEWLSLHAQYRQDQDVITALIARCEETKRRLIELSGESSAKGMGYTLKKVNRKGSVDYERLLEDHKIQDTERYRKKGTTYWTIGKDK